MVHHSHSIVYFASTCLLTYYRLVMRVDSIIVSLYDESGVEIENVEMLLCEEGETVTWPLLL